MREAYIHHQLHKIMRFNISNIKRSRRDVLQKITLPRRLTHEVAEFFGIMVGDGHIGIYHTTKPKKRTYYQLQISGHIKDKKYQMSYINKLILKLFNIKFHVDIIKEHNIIILRKQSQGICEFLRKETGIENRKDNVSIPGCILSGNKKIKAAFLRGLADADFCFTVKYKPNVYPVIHGDSKSKKLIEQCSEMLNELGVENYWRKEEQWYEKRKKRYVIYRVYVNGFLRVKKFMEEVGFQNRNKTEKWEKAKKKRNLDGIKHIPKKYIEKKNLELNVLCNRKLHKRLLKCLENLKKKEYRRKDLGI